MKPGHTDRILTSCSGEGVPRLRLRTGHATPLSMICTSRWLSAICSWVMLTPSLFSVDGVGVSCAAERLSHLCFDVVGLRSPSEVYAQLRWPESSVRSASEPFDGFLEVFDTLLAHINPDNLSWNKPWSADCVFQGQFHRPRHSTQQ